jgi:hypothetical protein
MLTLTVATMILATLNASPAANASVVNDPMSPNPEPSSRLPLPGQGPTPNAQRRAAGASRFRVVTRDGCAWLEGADGKPFWSLGVCCVTPGQDFDKYDPAKPEYAGFRYYENGPAWAKAACARLQDWGFDTIGAWSDLDLLKPELAPAMHVMPVIHMGSTAGAPWRDMWDPKVVADMEACAKAVIDPAKKDPRIVGYFSDNEMGWWEGALLEWAFKGAGTRAHFVEVLNRRYTRWSDVLRDFDAVGAASVDDLRTKGRLYLHPGGHGMAAVQEYVGVLAERYYSLCDSIIKKLDPGALFLGDRYISNFYPEVARAAGRYVDVVSTNLNADWSDGSFARFYLPALFQATGKPILISEYYFAAMDNRSGNKNDSSGFPTVQTQRERAEGFLATTQKLVHTPYVVGAHWFQYTDEPKFGRPDGENYDMGLVDIDDKPYDELTAAAKSVDPNEARSHLGQLSPKQTLSPGGRCFVTADNAEAPYLNPAVRSDLRHWPRDRAFVPPAVPANRADLYEAWDERGLWLAVYWYEDRFAESFYKGGKLPQEAHARFHVKTGTADLDIDLDDPKAVAHRAEDGVRVTAFVFIPAAELGAAAIRSGARVRVDATLTTRSDAYTERWSIDSTLAR